MGRKPKRVTALRKMREAIGLEQKQVAARVGVNLNTYQSYELGRLRVPWDVCADLSAAFFVDPRSIHDPQSPAPVFADGLARTPFTREEFARRKAFCSQLKFDFPAAATVAHQIGGWIELLLQAAENEGGGLDGYRRRLVVERAICRALTAVRKDHGLEAATDQILEDRPVTEKWRVNVGTLRRDKELARTLGYRRMPNDFDEDVKVLSHTAVISWAPGQLEVPPAPAATKTETPTKTSTKRNR